MENIDKEVKTLISKVIKAPEDRLKDEANIFSDLGVDSLLGVEIFAALDKKYNINIPEEKLKDVQTVGDLVSLVKNFKK